MDELSEAELRYYNDLFKICSDSAEKSSSNYDSSGKIPALKATSLFRSANLSNEIINKVSLYRGEGIARQGEGFWVWLRLRQKLLPYDEVCSYYPYQ